MGFGESSVYVRPFHRAAGGRWQISPGGGGYPVWSRDEHTLYYQGLNSRINAVEYAANGDSFTAGMPRVWSETPVRLEEGGLIERSTWRQTGSVSSCSQETKSRPTRRSC